MTTSSDTVRLPRYIARLNEAAVAAGLDVEVAGEAGAAKITWSGTESAFRRTELLRPSFRFPVKSARYFRVPARTFIPGHFFWGVLTRRDNDDFFSFRLCTPPPSCLGLPVRIYDIAPDIEAYEFTSYLFSLRRPPWKVEGPAIGFNGNPAALLANGIVKPKQVPRGKCPSGRMRIWREGDGWESWLQHDGSLLHLRLGGRGGLSELEAYERLVAARADESFQRTLRALLPPR